MTGRNPSLLATLGIVALLSAGCRPDDPGLEPLALSPSGAALGPVTAATPFDADRLRRLFPDASLIETQDVSEGEPYPILRIEMDGVPWLELRSRDGASIHSVEILEAAEVARLPASHGARYEKLYIGQSAPSCDPGMEEQSGLVICTAPLSDHVRLVFDGVWDGPDGRLPPPGILSTWEVQRIIWLAPGP